MESITSLLLSNVILAAALALFAFAITRVWRNPHLAHALWLLVLLKLVTPAVVPMPLPNFDLSAASATSDAAIPHELTVRAGEDTPGEPAPPSHAEPTPSVSSVAFQTSDELAPQASDRSGLFISSIFTVWLAGITIFAYVTAYRCMRFRRLLSIAKEADSDLVSDVQRLATEMKLKFCPSVQVVGARIPPLVWSNGFQPCILFPEELLADLDCSQREAVIVHELAHIRRRDHLVRWIEATILTLFWWYPVAWWASRRMRQAEEECCDAWVVSMLPTARRSYSLALSQTVDFLTECRHSPALGGTAFGSFPLKRRIEMILHQDTSRRMPWVVFSFVLLFAAVVLPVVAQNEKLQEKSAASRGASTVDSAKEDSAEGNSTEDGIARKSTNQNRESRNNATNRKQDAAVASTANPSDRSKKEEPTRGKKIIVHNGKIDVIKDIDVASLADGQIVEILVRAGEKVKKGQVLARLDDTEAKLKLAEAQARLDAARPNRSVLAEATLTVEQASTNYDRARRLADTAEIITQSQVEKLQHEFELAKIRRSAAEEDFARATKEQDILGTVVQLAERNLDRQVCRSPIDGMVVDIKRDAGEAIEIGKSLFQIINMDRLIISAYVDGPKEWNLKGSDVRIEFKKQRNGKPIVAHGKVTFVSPFAHRATGELLFRTEFENPVDDNGATLVHPGMRSTMVITARE